MIKYVLPLYSRAPHNNKSAKLNDKNMLLEKLETRLHLLKYNNLDTFKAWCDSLAVCNTEAHFAHFLELPQIRTLPCTLENNEPNKKIQLRDP